MQIIDLDEQHQQPYFMCLEGWSDEIREAGNHKEVWYQKMKDKGLGVKLAVEDGQTCGMIQYAPIEYGFAEGRDLYFIYCIWVHGYKKHGVGNRQKRGLGKALLQAAEEDIKVRGAKGIAAWGITMPFFMRASWFKKQGYGKVDKEGMMALLWKPLTDDAEAPKWFRQKKTPEKIAGKVAVTSLINGWCPAMNLANERAKRAAAELGDKVDFREINTFDRATFLEWGSADALFIDGKPLRLGPPPKYEKIRKKIARRVKKLST